MYIVYTIYIYIYDQYYVYRLVCRSFIYGQCHIEKLMVKQNVSLESLFVLQIYIVYTAHHVIPFLSTCVEILSCDAQIFQNLFSYNIGMCLRSVVKLMSWAYDIIYDMISYGRMI